LKHRSFSPKTEYRIQSPTKCITITNSQNHKSPTAPTPTPAPPTAAPPTKASKSVKTMVYSLTVPNEYGYVVLGAGIGSVICNIVLAGPVMKGRSQLQVPLPNMYATPGVHKHADEFNRIQRSHQNYLEMLDSYIAMTLLGGLQYPIACAVGSEY
jgi:glutathione S-transferase